MKSSDSHVLFAESPIMRTVYIQRGMVYQRKSHPNSMLAVQVWMLGEAVDVGFVSTFIRRSRV